MERALSKEACEILPGLIVECLDNDPSKRPTARSLIEALGMTVPNFPKGYRRLQVG